MFKDWKVREKKSLKNQRLYRGWSSKKKKSKNLSLKPG